MASRKRKSRERREPVVDTPLRATRAEPDDGGSDDVSAPRKRASRSTPPMRRLFYWCAVLGLWALIVAGGAVVYVAANLPPVHSLEIPRRPPSIEIVGTDGKTMATRGEMHGATLTLKEMPPFLPKAFLAIEDHRFYSHWGVDPIGLVRAAAANLSRRGVSQGGSTLTQQLAKNLFLTQERTFARKLQELVLALWLERKFSKTEILELYLNRVYFGAGAYGVDAAAQRYFGKSARQVTIAESAMLAGLVRSPSRLAPNRNPNGAERRAQVVIAAMTSHGFITETMAKHALAQPARAVKVAGNGSANYIADWIMDVLDDLVGHIDQDLVVRTSIDPALQAAAEAALVNELAQKGEKFGVSQGALIAMTPTGAVRALVGGRNYAESQFNRAVAARRQPGSAFKPFVYLTAVERGLSPETVREDKPIAIKGWRPENYSREYYGNVSLTQGLAHSLNTISVRLTQEFGPSAVTRTAYRLGIASKLEANPSIALGTSEVSLIELTSAYAPFANGGSAIAPYVVERVSTKAGKALYQRSPHDLGRIIEPRYVAMMNAMMRETMRVGTATKGQIAGWQSAGKTGTSQDFRDAWFVGYTAHLVTGVWLGNDDSSPTKRATGGGMPVEIWAKFMRGAHQGVAAAALPGQSAPPTLASIVQQAVNGTPSANAPPANVQPSAGAQRPQQPSGGLDGWLIDRLFGNRH
ncbi:MAG TPA: transglycosylase domain-containing protein [Xanthobacteraceae bacterium]|nr:transglycosylase domain-containing protein [Xanthobacteraceae bacterium]